MAKLAIFKPPELTKKKLEVKYLFKFEIKKSISSIAYKNFDENYYFDRRIKKTTPSINITFSAKVRTIKLLQKLTLL